MDNLKAPDLLSCDASELANFLLKNRFQDDSMATASFLLEGTSSLPNAEAISAQLMGGAPEEQVEEPEQEEISFDFGDALTEPSQVSMTNPRGKFQWTLHEEGIQYENAKDDHLLVPANAVEKMILFPKPEDCRISKGNVSDMVLLCVKEGGDDSVPFKNKTLKQICFQLPTDPPKGLSGEEGASDWMELLSVSLSLDPQLDIARIYNPTVPKEKRGGYSFQSHNEDNTSTTTGGMPFVKCYKGVQDGVLYPMEEGLLFFKPPFFLPRSEMHSIACGRGSGGSRYVDLVVTLDGGESQNELEFTNIHRDEMRVLNGYIHEVLIPAMTKDANGGDSEEGSNASNNHGGTTPTTISATASEGSPSSVNSRPSKRKASKAAREATRAELSPSQDTESEEEEEDEGWNSAEEEDTTSDGDLSLTGVNEVPIDGESDEEEDDYMEEEEEGDEEMEEQDDETEDEGSATESDDESEPKSKKARKD